MSQNKEIAIHREDEFDFKETLAKYVYHWKWFLGVIVASLAIAYIYLHYAVPQYEANSKMMIKSDDKNDPSFSELSAFADLGLGDFNNKVEDEIEVVKSRRIIESVVRKLKLHYSYQQVGNFTGFSRYPLYKNIPIEVIGDSTVSLAFPLMITIIDENNVRIELEDKVIASQLHFGEQKKFSFGHLVVNKTDAFQKKHVGIVYEVRISTIEGCVNSWKGRLQAETAEKKSSVINLSVKDPSQERAVDFLNELMFAYNEDARRDKNMVSKNTVDFINDRMLYVSNELEDVENSAETYKTQNNFIDLVTESTLTLENESGISNQIVAINTQLQLAIFMLDYMNKNENKGHQLLPSNLGLTDVSVNEMIVEYNKQLIEYNKAIENGKKNNPVVLKLESQVSGLFSAIKQSLSNLKNVQVIQLNELEKTESLIRGKISKVPEQEKAFRSIMRQQQIKESLYLYLLQKREESSITLAVNVSPAKIVDPAYSSGQIISPKKLIIYPAALILAIILTVSGIYLAELLDTHVHSKMDIEHLNLPFLGNIPHTELNDTNFVVRKNTNSSVSEAFRLLRTNIQFLMGGETKQLKTIFVTSSIAKEGKSFVAINLASSYALNEKNVLLIGLDLRIPKIMKYMGLNAEKGVSNYLIEREKAITEYIIPKNDRINFDILAPGDIPPNPAELLSNPRIGEMFAELQKKYDYIIVDTAPVAPVADTFILSAYADAFLYIIRSNYLEKTMLGTVESIYKDKKLKNMGLIINDIRINSSRAYRYGYGYGYAYGYSETHKKPIWKKLLGRS